MPMIAAVPAISTLSLETEARRPSPPLWLESIAPLWHRSPLPGRDPRGEPLAIHLSGARVPDASRDRLASPDSYYSEAHTRIGVRLSPSGCTPHSRPGRARRRPASAAETIGVDGDVTQSPAHAPSALARRAP